LVLSPGFDHLVAVLNQAQQLGFLGPGRVEDHIVHAQQYVAVLDGTTGRALDLGTGGGVPGLVLALHFPETKWWFLDAMAKRCAFLRQSISDLGLSSSVRVLEGRAEELGRNTDLRSSFQVVTARSFGAPALVAECAAPFLSTGGRLVVSEPPAPVPADRWPAEGLAQVGLRRTDSPTDALAVIEQFAPCPEQFPRRTGVPTKRPLF